MTDPAQRYTLKPSYLAMQTIAAIFNACEACELPILLTPGKSPAVDGYDVCDATLIYAAFKKGARGAGAVYWNSTDMLKIKEYESTVSMQIVTKMRNPRLVDLLDGRVYDFSKHQLKLEGNTYFFTNIPVLDRPLLIAFDDFIALRP